MNTKIITKTALITALLCILAPLSIPIGPVPISLTNLVLYFSVYIVGFKGATLSYIVYYLLGIAGLPVFSGYSGGLGKAMGATGGYLVGFIFIVIICGIVVEKFKDSRVLHILSMIVSTVIAYAFGTAWFCYITKNTVGQALVLCVYPFIIGDLVKMFVAMFLGFEVRKRLN